MKKKAKKVDINSMPRKKVEKLAVSVGVQVREVCDKAADEINAILSIYGMKVKLAVAFEQDGQINLNEVQNQSKRA